MYSNLSMTQRRFFCVQDGRDSTVAAAEPGNPGADCCWNSEHHEGQQGQLLLLHVQSVHYNTVKIWPYIFIPVYKKIKKVVLIDINV